MRTRGNRRVAAARPFPVFSRRRRTQCHTAQPRGRRSLGWRLYACESYNDSRNINNISLCTGCQGIGQSSLVVLPGIPFEPARCVVVSVFFFFFLYVKGVYVEKTMCCMVFRKVRFFGPFSVVFFLRIPILFVRQRNRKKQPS